jgi:Flp pilus assembly protein TadG
VIREEKGRNYMQCIRNENGAVLVFITLMIVLLMILVGMGLDTGHLAYIRSQGQPAVDAAALSAASAIPTNNPALVKSRAAALNYGAGNPGTGNNYLDSPHNLIADNNITLIHFDQTANPQIQLATGVTSTSVGDANGVRVALESTNPYGGPVGAPIKSPLFLTPLFNFMGIKSAGTTNVSVSAVARIQGLAGMPIAVADNICGTNATLNFQGGGNSGWETYYVSNASATVIRDLWDAIDKCEGQPPVDVGYCGNLNNGVISNIFNKNIQDMYNADPSRCYLIPVVDHNVISNGNFNQCSNIVDWAKLCLDAKDPFNKTGSQKGQLRGTVTCGQSVYTSRDTSCYVPNLVRDTKSGM